MFRPDSCALPRSVRDSRPPVAPSSRYSVSCGHDSCVLRAMNPVDAHPGTGRSCARFCSWGGLTSQLASTASCRRWLPSSPGPRSMPSGTSPPASCSTRSAAERAAAAPSARSPRSTPTCGCSSRAVAGHSSAGRTASRNHSDGMCPACKGLGKRITVDVDKLLDLDRSVEQGAIRQPAYDIGDPTCCSRPINGGVVTGSVGYAVGAPPAACR